MLGGADNPNGELPSYITGADTDSPEFRTLYPENICIFGVVTHVIHRTRELR